MNFAIPVTTPVALIGVLTQGLAATGEPGSTGTVTDRVVVRAPLLIVTVKESVVLTPAL